MSNELSVGMVLEGKVTAIKEYGAFVSLSPGRSGLVHISQIANEYVKQVEDYLEVGDSVQVKIIDISDAGKISLSIKQASPLTRKDGKTPDSWQGRRGQGKSTEKNQMNSLEDKLKKWMKSSEERISDLQAKQKRK